MMKNLKNGLKTVLIAQKMRPDALNTTQNPHLFTNHSFEEEKIKKNLNKLPFLAVLVEWVFLRFFLFFSKTILCKVGGLGFLRCIQCIRTLLFSYQKQLSDNFLDFSL